jgi:hypothetical protein
MGDKDTQAKTHRETSVIIFDNGAINRFALT